MIKFILTICFTLLLGSAFASAQEVLFEDNFSGGLKPGWNWLRGRDTGRRFAPEGLELKYDSRDENSTSNVLVRTTDFVGKGTVSIETELTAISRPVQQYQQAGLCWLQNGRVVFKLVHELVDGKTFIFPGKIPTTTNTVRLRITITGNDLSAEFRNEGETCYRRIYEGKLTVTPHDQISLQCWNGPQLGDHWMRFRFFRILRQTD